jgi:predicted esterase YcpF (UPF0227 family)
LAQWNNRSAISPRVIAAPRLQNFSRKTNELKYVYLDAYRETQITVDVSGIVCYIIFVTTRKSTMNILYVHGFGSSYNPTHEKIQYLETLGTVVGVNVDYCKGFHAVYDKVLDVVKDKSIDLIVGTSMGGYIAAIVGAKAGIPFVSINPATSPGTSLQRWVGNFVDYNGNHHCLTEGAVHTYPDIATDGHGLVLLDRGDEVINANETAAALDAHYTVYAFLGGSHRFKHMQQAMPIITEFYNRAEAAYGFGA